MNIFKRLYSAVIKELASTVVTKSSSYTLSFLNDAIYILDENNQPVRNCSTLFRCVQLIGDNAPDAPLKFAYEFGEGDDVESNHPIVQLFNNPSEDSTYRDFIAKSAVYYVLYGECFWYIQESKGQQIEDSQLRKRYAFPSSFTILHPKFMTERLDPLTNKLDYWDYNLNTFNPRPDDSGNTHYPKDKVIQIKNVNPYNTNRGLSSMTALDKMLSINGISLEYQKNFIKNGAAPSLIITQDASAEVGPTTDKDNEALLKKFNQRHRGSKNAGKAVALGPGMGVHAISIDHDKQQFIEILKYTEEKIIQAMGIPKSLIGITENLNRALSDNEREYFWRTTLKPITTLIEDAVNNRLLKDSDIRAYYDYSKVIQEEKLTVNDIPNLISMRVPPNMINDRLGLNFDDIPGGDEILVPFNLVPLSQILNGGMEETPQGKMLKQVMKEEVSKMLGGNVIDVTPEVKQIEHVKKKYSEREVEKSSRKKNIHEMISTVRNKSERALQSRISRFAGEQKARVLKALEQHKSFDNGVLKQVNQPTLIRDIEAIFNSEDTLLEQSITPIMTEVITDAGNTALSILNIDRDYILNSEVLLNRINKIKGINQTTFNNIRIQISDALNGVDNEGKVESVEQIAKRIKSVYNDFPKWRARKIAQTETSAMISEATQKEYMDNGVQYNSWSSAGDSRVREEHLSNEAQGPIPTGQAFQNGELYPGDSSIGCRCSLIPEINFNG